MDRIAALLAGASDDLQDIQLDMHGISPFYQQVYALARQIPPGQTTTYGAMAEALQAPGSARAIGQALGFNPFAPVVPCHRVLAAQSGAGGFSAAGGLSTKLRMLQIERAVFGATPGLFDAG
jgi:methylated-DNA-[protein]-cysteine S-methyltransferase